MGASLSGSVSAAACQQHGAGYEHHKYRCSYACNQGQAQRLAASPEFKGGLLDILPISNAFPELLCRDRESITLRLTVNQLSQADAAAAVRALHGW